MSEPPQASFVQSLDTLRAGLQAMKVSLTWRGIASTFYPGVPAGTLAAIAKGREPKKLAIRLALGLPVSVETTPAPGVNVSPGSLALASSRTCACGCGRPFLPRTWNQVRIPGHPRRR